MVGYVGPEVLRAAVIFGGRAIGVEPPELHRAPLLSTTLREFWGVRCNRPVGAWLRFHAFEPCATVGSLVLTSPLLVEPMLQCLGI